MKGMHDAAQDPAMLAQLMRDMQVRRWWSNFMRW
jgi:hypothetical protein